MYSFWSYPPPPFLGGQHPISHVHFGMMPSFSTARFLCKTKTKPRWLYWKSDQFGVASGFISWLSHVIFLLWHFWYIYFFGLALPFHEYNLHPYWVNELTPCLQSRPPCQHSFCLYTNSPRCSESGLHTPDPRGAALVGSMIFDDIFMRVNFGPRTKNQAAWEIEISPFLRLLALLTGLAFHSTYSLLRPASTSWSLIPRVHTRGIVLHLCQVLFVWLWKLLNFSELLFPRLTNGTKYDD